MDPRDGHRECPTCLGEAHVTEDVENPCVAALDLPLEERARRAKGLEQYEAPSPIPSVREGRQCTRAQKRRTSTRSAGDELACSAAKSSFKRQRVVNPIAQDKAHLEILAAIQGLSERLGKMEAQHVTTGSGLNVLCESSHEGLPAYQGESAGQEDVLSLYAQESLLDASRLTEQEGHTSSLARAGSTQESTEDGEVSATDVLSRVLSAAKVVGLSAPVEAQAPAQGVWAGISKSQPVVSIPAAPDYLLMLKRLWNNPTAPPQFNPGCRRLTKDQLETESGLADMPPVEREIAALTSLGPARVTTNPKCPVRECHKTDTLVCRSYNAAARAARSGNALAILLAAIRKTLGPEDQDTMSLVDSALITHSQLTRDVGAAMSSAVLARRQVWLAQTSLPEGVRKDLIKMAVVPGKVFHPDSQGVFDSAEQSQRTRESVRRTFGRAAPSSYQHRAPGPVPFRSGASGAGRGQSVEHAVSRGRRPPQRQPAHQRRFFPRASPQTQYPPRAAGSRGRAT